MDIQRPRPRFAHGLVLYSALGFALESRAGSKLAVENGDSLGCESGFTNDRRVVMATIDVSDPVREVLNQPPPLEPVNLFEVDLALREALEREGGGWGVDRASEAGAVAGSAETREHSRRAERNLPILRTHDRFGNRID